MKPVGGVVNVVLLILLAPHLDHNHDLLAKMMCRAVVRLKVLDGFDG